jgi:REP element-mobilizing transposase RayT
MPRSARGWNPDAPTHVMDRGFQGAAIFAAEPDRRFLLSRAARVFRETGTRCFGFAVMTNHFHFLLRPDGAPLGVALHRLKTAVALRFRRAHGDRGPAFQSRFRTNVLADRDEDAFRTVLAYILLNPLRAGIVPDLDTLERWPWTALPALLGHNDLPWLDRETALDAVAPEGGDREAALRSLLRSIVEADPSATDDGMQYVQCRAAEEAGLRRGTSAVTGQTAVERLAAVSPAFRRREAKDPRSTPDAIAEQVARVLGVDVGLLRSRSRSVLVSNARAAACALGWDAGFNSVEMARVLGISGQAARQARARGSEIVRGWGQAQLCNLRA